MITITTTTTITSQQIADLMVTAIEGGSNYWCASIDNDGPYADPKTYERDFTWKVETHEDDPAELTPAKIEAGLQKLADEYPTFFHDLVGDDALDADGADVAFQLMLFGDVVYG